MNIPKLTLRARRTNRHLWTGSALQFIRDNELSQNEVSDMCDNLRHGCAWACGGGAAPEFVVSLA